jgi:hypothetical protein
MPLFSAVQTPTELSSGDKLSVLNGENLALNALTMAVSLTPQPAPIDLAIYNNSGQSVSLVASPVGTALVAPGLYYAVKAGAAITAGTIWLAR